MAPSMLGGAVMGLVVVTAVTAAKGELNVTSADLVAKAGLRGRAGRDRRLRVPPQPGHELLDPLHQRAAADRR